MSDKSGATVEEQLRARNAELQALLDLMPAMLCIKDTNNVFLRVNRRLAEATGKPVEELEGRPASEIYPLEAAKYYADDLEVIRSRAPKLGIVETLRGADGQELWVRTDKVPLRGADGVVTGIVVMVQDITEKKKLEEQFRQMQKMESVGTLAAGVAHDFNNILAVIQMQVESLMAEAGLAPAHSGMIQGIGEAAQRATALTRQLLLFSRKIAMHQRDLDLNLSVDGVAGMLARILGEDVELDFRRSAQPLFIHADAGMMDQALMNLAVNSRDAMPKGGRLVLETSSVEFDETVGARSAQARPGAFACLSVSDTGCGIPAENLLRIFEPFFTTKEVGKGTGLGLATLFGIVQQHRGWVEVDSAVGKGTTFRIYLPRIAEKSVQTAEQPAETSVRGGDETILLVEDDEFLRPFACRVLEQFGYRVVAVGDGPEALEAWKLHRDEIRLLLTDMVMPSGMSGRELVERLTKEDPRLKVVYASGYSPEFVSKDFYLEEGVNFIAKPFQAEMLARIIRRSLDAQ
jgi:PAS domain S-box-containing protein